MYLALAWAWVVGWVCGLLAASWQLKRQLRNYTLTRKRTDD